MRLRRPFSIGLNRQAVLIVQTIYQQTCFVFQSRVVSPRDNKSLINLYLSILSIKVQWIYNLIEITLRNMLEYYLQIRILHISLDN